MNDKLSLQDIWRVDCCLYGTPFGTVYLCGFMNLFGASLNYPIEAVKSMQVATEAQVHYAINGAFRYES